MIGIVTPSTDDPSEETRALLNAYAARYGAAQFIHPVDVCVSLIHGANAPCVTLVRHDKTRLNLAELHGLIVRSSAGYEESVALLALTAQALGVSQLDPWDRFATLGKSNKLLSTYRRWQMGVGTTTHICFGQAGYDALLRELPLPLVIKPAGGNHGQGVTLLRAPTERHVRAYENMRGGMLLQPYVDFAAEFRVLICNGQIIGAAEKRRQGSRFKDDGTLSGTTFVKASVPSDLADWLKRNLPQGLLGVDVGYEASGTMRIIETNHAPEFHRLAEAHETDVRTIADAISSFGFINQEEQWLSTFKPALIQPASSNATAASWPFKTMTGATSRISKFWRSFRLARMPARQ